MALLLPNNMRTQKFYRSLALDYVRTRVKEGKELKDVGPAKIPREFRKASFFKHLLIEVMADPRIKFTPQKFAHVFSVPESQVHHWLMDRRIGDEVHKRIKRSLGSGHLLRPIYRKIIQQAKRGSFKHQRLILEMVGDYIPGMKIEHDTTSIEDRFRKLEDQRMKRLLGTTDDANVIDAKVISSE